MQEIPDPTAMPDDELVSKITDAAWDTLRSVKSPAGATQVSIGPLVPFLADAEENHKLDVDEKLLLLDQAELMLNHLYPHLPFKLETFKFTHPVKWLEDKIRPFVDTISEADFHGHLIASFSLIRDAHTLYGLPSPYRGAMAFLPFQMKYYTDRTGRHYVVTRVIKGFEHDFFQPGAEILKWIDIPVDLFVQVLAGRLPGGNMDAEFTRGTFHCTLRPLTFVQPPRKEELPATLIEYLAPDSQEPRKIRIPWGVVTGRDAATSFTSSAFSMSAIQADARDWTASLTGCSHARNTPGAVYGVAPPAPLSPAAIELTKPSTLPGTFDVQFTGAPFKKGLPDPALLVTDPPSDARFGYLRIKRFSDGSKLGNTSGIVQEFARLLGLLDSVAPDGLILDIRSNPGGDVKAAEQMLQMLTPGHITPCNFHLANTETVVGALARLTELSQDRQKRRQLTPQQDVDFTEAQRALQDWLPDAAGIPLPLGERLTSGQPLTRGQDCNSIGQIYHGRVVLLIDALTYSAAEIFAAGFQDHVIGQIIGMDGTTGGGGANVWNHDELLQRLGVAGVALAKLPRDAMMTLAVRRNSRVRFNNGKAVEDVGVNADIPYAPDSADDVLTDNPGMFHLACDVAMQLPHFRADVMDLKVMPDGSVNVVLRSINIDALDVFLDGVQTLDKHPVVRLADGNASSEPVSIPAAPGRLKPGVLKIVAYTRAPGVNGPELFPAAVRRGRLPAAASASAGPNSGRAAASS